MAPESGSVEVTVRTAVLFSATLAAAADVMLGASFTLVTVTAMVWVVALVPSETWTWTS